MNKFMLLEHLVYAAAKGTKNKQLLQVLYSFACISHCYPCKLKENATWGYKSYNHNLKYVE